MITVAIVTKNRQEKLMRCLESICLQTINPKHVIIIDNDAAGSSKIICDLFKDKMKIKYFIEPTVGVPKARNYALKKCQTELVGFVDDDCVLDSRWIEMASKAVRMNKDTTVFLGKTGVWNPNSLVALALYYRQIYWYKYSIDRDGLVGPFGYDTKNILIRVAALKINNITFDQRLFIHATDGHSDTDLGLQIKRAGLLTRYLPELIAYHEEVESFLYFTRKAYHRGRAGFGLYQKWKLRNELVYLPDIFLSKYLRRIKCWPGEYRSWLKGSNEKSFLRRLVIFMLIKTYDFCYLKGFVDRSMEVGDDLMSEARRLVKIS